MGFFFLTFIVPRFVIYFYIKTNQMHQFLKFIYFCITLYMFRTVFPSIIRSSGLYICLLLYVQSWTPDDGRKDRPKHVECYAKENKVEKLVHQVGFNIGVGRLCCCDLKWNHHSKRECGKQATAAYCSYLSRIYLVNVSTVDLITKPLIMEALLHCARNHVAVGLRRKRRKVLVEKTV
jgi:hypothetical protein